MHLRLLACLLIGLPLLITSNTSGQTSASEAPGTRVYQIAFLKRHPERKELAKDEGSRIQAAHMANIHAMADRGVLVAAGPFDDKPSIISGVFFFVLPTPEETRKLAESDPTVVEHRNTVEVLSWRGPVGIGDEYKRLHKENPATPEDMGMHPFVILNRSGKEMSEAVKAQHEAYWQQVKASDKVLAMGPVTGDASATDIVIFKRIADTEAASLTAADPAVKQGMRAAEAHRWWSSAHVFPE